MPPTVIHTIDGSKPAARAIRNAGAVIGARSSSVGSMGEIPVGFIDYPFRNPVPFPRHFGAVRQFRPEIAVAPDIEDALSRDHTLRQADRLAEYARAVVIVPKDIPVSSVPDRFRLGLPFAGGWSGAALQIGDDKLREYDRSTHDIHILGGSPSDQLRLRGRFGDRIKSLDTSLPLLYAQNGRIWYPEGQIQTGKPIGIYDRLMWTLRHMRRAWGHDAEELFIPEGYREFIAAAPYPAPDRDIVVQYTQSGAHGAPPLIEHDPETGRIPAYIEHDLDRRRQFAGIHR